MPFLPPQGNLPPRYADLAPFLGRLAFFDSVAAGQIVAQAIMAGHIKAGTITAAQIAAATITANQIAAGTITAAQIAAQTITAAQIAAATITANQIAAGTITGSNILAGTLTANLISANALAVGVNLDNAATTNVTPYNTWVNLATGVTVTISNTSDFVVFAVTIQGTGTNFQMLDEADFQIVRTDTGATLVLSKNVITVQSGLASTASLGSTGLLYLLSGLPVGSVTLKPQAKLINGSASGTLGLSVTDCKIFAFVNRQTGP